MLSKFSSDIDGEETSTSTSGDKFSHLKGSLDVERGDACSFPTLAAGKDPFLEEPEFVRRGLALLSEEETLL